MLCARRYLRCIFAPARIIFVLLGFMVVFGQSPIDQSNNKDEHISDYSLPPFDVQDEKKKKEVISSNVYLKLGDTFPDLNTFTKKLQAMQNHTKQYYVKGGGRTLAAYPLEGANPDCVYQYVKYCCKYGKNRHKKDQKVYSKQTRKTRTIKCNCGSSIRVVLDKSKCNLVISAIDLVHTGHEGSEEFYDLLPEMRRLDPETLEMVHQYWTLKVPRQIIMEEVFKLKKITLSSKDLDNIIRKFINYDDDSLKAAYKLLKQKFGCKTTVVRKSKKLKDGKEIKEFKSLYFSTEKMRTVMASWPEIVFIDGTYKLLKRNLIVFVLAVQDSNRMTQIVGMGLLADEKKDTVRDFLQCFKEDHGEKVCNGIKAFMSDKDLTERGVIKELFPWVQLLLCEFHVLRIFSRTITTNAMRITKEERSIILSLLDKLVKCRSEEHYMILYREFLEKASEEIATYFNKNWHEIRSQWTRYGMSQSNLGNYTNNCVESTNARLKDEINPHSSLSVFIIGFFRFYDRRNKTIRFFLKDQHFKHSLHKFQEGTAEHLFSKLLTEKPCAIVIKQLERRAPMRLREIDEDSQTCWIQSGFVMVKTSTTSCDCTEFTSHNLPCRHIFALRCHFKLPLFTPDLCAKRWTREYDRNHQPILMNLNLPVESIVNYVEAKISKDNNVGQMQKLLPKKRKEIMLKVAKDLAGIGAHASGVKFEKRVQLLETIKEFWLQNIEVDVNELIAKLQSTVEQEQDISGEGKVVVMKSGFKTPSKAKILNKCTIKRSKK